MLWGARHSTKLGALRLFCEAGRAEDGDEI